MYGFNSAKCLFRKLQAALLCILSKMLGLLVKYIVYTQCNNASNTGLNLCVCIAFNLIASIGRNAEQMQIFFFWFCNIVTLKEKKAKTYTNCFHCYYIMMRYTESFKLYVQYNVALASSLTIFIRHVEICYQI